MKKRRMSARTRNSSNTLVGGPRRDRYSVASPRPPFSDFRWYQRHIARPVPRVIPGASLRHRQSTLLDSTAVGPTRTHRTMRAGALRPRSCLAGSAISGLFDGAGFEVVDPTRPTQITSGRGLRAPVSARGHRDPHDPGHRVAFSGHLSE
jgi:hypothetical protein